MPSEFLHSSEGIDDFTIYGSTNLFELAYVIRRKTLRKSEAFPSDMSLSSIAAEEQDSDKQIQINSGSSSIRRSTHPTIQVTRPTVVDIYSDNSDDSIASRVSNREELEVIVKSLERLFSIEDVVIQRVSADEVIQGTLQGESRNSC